MVVDMKQLVLQAGCEAFRDSLAFANATANHSVLTQIIRGCALINDTTFPIYVDIIDADRKRSTDETDSGAVMYIVAVLVFYSFGIIVMIVKYLRREKRELEEERILDDFFRSMPEYKKEREQNKMNKVAIHAFHALTSFSENVTSSDDKDVCSSGGEEDAPLRVETIHEHEEHEDESEHALLNSSRNKLATAGCDSSTVTREKENNKYTGDADELTPLKDLTVQLNHTHDVLKIERETHL